MRWFKPNWLIRRKDEELGRGPHKGRGGIDADYFRNVSKERFVSVDCSYLRSQLQVRKGGSSIRERSNDFLKIFLTFHSSMRNIYSSHSYVPISFDRFFPSLLSSRLSASHSRKSINVSKRFSTK